MGIAKKYLLFITFIFAFISCSIAQIQDAEIIVKNNKKYYVHVVQQGNTLWGIHTLYDVPVEDIVNENPGIEKGINVGQTIFIPVINSEVKEVSNAASKTHVVEQGETLYGISKMHNMSVEDLLKLNPEAERGLQVGQVLIISSDSQINNQPIQNTKTPVEETKVTFQDSLLRHTVLDHETLYAISKRFMVSIDTLIQLNGIKKNAIKPGDILIIPLKQPTFEHVQVREIPSTNPLTNNSEVLFAKKDSYKILVLLPMNYASSQSAISGMDENASLNKYTKVAIDFYMGIKLALDSLQKLGLNADVQLIDTRVDSNVVLNYLKTCENNKPDLIIGPLMPNLLKATARWCKTNKVPLLSPVASNSALLKDNPYFFSSVPSDLRLLEGMADDLALNHSQHNLILVTSGIAGDLKNYDLIRSRINSQLKSNAMRSKLKEVGYRGELNAAIINDTVNIFIFPSENRVAVSYFMTSMNKIKNTKGENVNITVYGLKEWENFEELKINYKQKLNLHYPSSINLNYSDSTVDTFIQQFRKKYKTDPGKFGIQGFDITYYFISNYLMQLNSPTHSVMNDFHFSSRGDGNGAENNNVFIMRYNGFDIEEASRVHE